MKSLFIVHTIAIIEHLSFRMKIHTFATTSCNDFMKSTIWALSSNPPSSGYAKKTTLLHVRVTRFVTRFVTSRMISDPTMYIVQYLGQPLFKVVLRNRPNKQILNGSRG